MMLQPGWMQDRSVFEMSGRVSWGKRVASPQRWRRRFCDCAGVDSLFRSCTPAASPEGDAEAGEFAVAGCPRKANAAVGVALRIETTGRRHAPAVVADRPATGLLARAFIPAASPGDEAPSFSNASFGLARSLRDSSSIDSVEVCGDPLGAPQLEQPCSVTVAHAVIEHAPAD